MIALVAVTVVVMAFGLYRLRRYDLEQIRAFEEFASDFHEAAAPLIADDETPDELLQFLAALNKKISDPTAAREFLRFVASRKNFVDNRCSSRTGRPAAVREFLQRRPELEKRFVQAVVSGILAISFRSRFWGYKLRLWFAAIDTNEKKEEIGASFGMFACQAAA